MTNKSNSDQPPVRDDAFDYDGYVRLHWPNLPVPQARSVATYIFLGWTVGEIGRADEVNLHKPASHESGYVRIDGIFRPA